MNNKKNLRFVLLFLIGIIFLSSFIFAYSSNNAQIATPGFGSSGGFGFTGSEDYKFNKEMCQAGQDFILQIDPLGCTPTIVRSDLLEEQNVPVFCPIVATKINPLIDIEAIDRITLPDKEFSKDVAGVGFFPARSALGVQNEINSLFLERVGYAVIYLRQNPKESEMPEFVEGNITARIMYDIENAFGVGKASFYLEQLDDSEWNKKYLENSFWKGKGFIRLEDADVTDATISIYSGQTRVTGPKSYQQNLATFSLEEGQTSRQVYLPTFDYCLGGLEVRLDDIQVSDTVAKLSVNDDEYGLAKNEKFLDNKCKIIEIERQGINQEIKINCKEDTGSNTFYLKIIPKINLSVNNKLGEYNLGDKLGEINEDGNLKGVYLAYAYTNDNSNNENQLGVSIAIIPQTTQNLTKEQINSFKEFVERYKSIDDGQDKSFWSKSFDNFKSIGFYSETFSKWSISGESFEKLGIGD